MICLLNHEINKTLIRNNHKFISTLSSHDQILIMNNTETVSFSFMHVITLFLIFWDIIGTTIVLLAIFSINNFNNNFKLHVISMSINDIGTGLTAIPRWIIKVTTFGFFFQFCLLPFFNYDYSIAADCRHG